MLDSRLHKMLTAVAGALVMCFALTCALPGEAMAACAVYDGTDKEWHGEDLQESDVFMSFDGAVPGDTLSHDAEIRLDRPLEPVTLYVKLDCDDATARALSDVTCSVSMDGRVVGAATLGELAVTPMSVGTYSAAATIDMHVEMTLPTSLGNEHQHEIYPVGWRFIAQEQDGSKPGDGPSAGGTELLPQTGDNMVLAYGPWLFAALGVGAIALATRRQSEGSCR